MVCWSKVLAWTVTAACVLITARGASVFARHATRVFSILALFSLSWAVLTPYYYQSDPPELLVGISGFLFAFVGVLLQREAHNPTTPRLRPFDGVEAAAREKDPFAGRGQGIALYLLKFLVIPSAVPVASSILGALLPTLNLTTSNKILDPVIPTLLLLVGYYEINAGIRAYSSSSVGKLLMRIIMSAYALTDSAYTVFAVYWSLYRATGEPARGLKFFTTPPRAPMNMAFLWAFLFLKVIFTVAFVALVLKESLSREDRRLPLRYKVLKFLGVSFPQPPKEVEPAWVGIARESRSPEGPEGVYYERLKLAQAGIQIAGEIDRVQGGPREWIVEGAFQHNMLVLRYWHENSERGSGAIVVERDSGTGDFRGCWLGYDKDRKRVGAGPYVLTEHAEQAEKSNEEWLATPTYFPPAKPLGGASAEAGD